MRYLTAQKKCLRMLCLLGVLVVSMAASPLAAELSAPTPQSKPVLTRAALPIAPIRAANVKLTTPLPNKKPDFGTPELHRLLAFGSHPVPRPRPMPVKQESLSKEDAALYQKIFDYQTAGQWSNADKYIEKLGDFRLRGHVLYQRYMHPTAYRTSFNELVGWMDLYADHPGAKKIHNLALARMPSDFKGHINRPRTAHGGINIRLDVLYDKGREYVSSKKRTATEKRDIKALHRSIRKDISRGGPTRAYKRLLEDPRAKALDIVEYDQIRAQIAQSYMLVGKLDKAKELAGLSAKRSGSKAPLAGWIGGLVAWRHGDYKEAAKLFESSASSTYSSPWGISAAAYWASRSHTRAGNIKRVSPWLQKAAEHPRTFYGLIATRALGKNFDFNWSMPDFTEQHHDALNNNPAGFRAMALATAGQYHLAEAEMRQIKPGKNKDLEQALIAYTNHAGLPSFSMRLASAFKHTEGGYYDAALYPLAPWRPENGYQLDKALIHAFIRQESKFNPQAKSHSGATGLMQIMPSTASFVTKNKKYKNRDGQHILENPQINMGIGQKYIKQLLEQGAVNGDMLSLAIAYNAGPGNLRRWKKSMSDIRDPLLFVESIPMSETRGFVERVMANYWIYRVRMKQPVPSLDSVAKGDWAHYVSMDGIVRADASVKPKAKTNHRGNQHYN